MPWGGSAPNQTYTRSDGVRTGAAICVTARNNAINDTAELADVREQDLATAIGLTWKRDGGNQPVANLPMNGYKFTGAAVAAARDEFARASQVQDSTLTYGGTAGGTANVITLTLSPAITAYIAGQLYLLKAASDNTGPVDVNINSVGQVNLYRFDGATELAAGDIQAGGMYLIGCNGTDFILLGCVGVALNAIGALTPATDKLAYFTSSSAAALADLTAFARTLLAGASAAAMRTTLELGTAALNNTGDFLAASTVLAPIGSILAWPTNAAPTGWLECDGSAVSRTTYASLFTLIGTTFGAGNGSTTFNLPDLRGEFVRGWDHGKGSDPNAGTRTTRGDGTTGDNVGTKQADEFKLHGHPFRWTSATSANGSGGFYVAGSNASPTNASAYTGTLGDTGGQQISGSGGSETRPRNVNMMYIIRAL